MGEEGERGREQKRSANNERRLCADQPPEGVRSGREARRDHGDRHPAEQQAARAEPVRERAEAHKDAREHERVGIDNPLKAADTRAEIALDRRKSNVHQARVE